jgi:hypothetical protein
MSLEDTLSNIMFDFVAQEVNEPFVESLLALKAGCWEEVAVLCADLPDSLARLAALGEPYAGDLKVTWLDYPGSDYELGACIFLFFSEAAAWNSLAVFSRQSYLASRGPFPNLPS